MCFDIGTNKYEDPSTFENNSIHHSFRQVFENVLFYFTPLIGRKPFLVVLSQYTVLIMLKYAVIQDISQGDTAILLKMETKRELYSMATLVW